MYKCFLLLIAFSALPLTGVKDFYFKRGDNQYYEIVGFQEKNREPHLLLYTDEKYKKMAQKGNVKHSYQVIGYNAKWPSEPWQNYPEYYNYKKDLEVKNQKLLSEDFEKFSEDLCQKPYIYIFPKRDPKTEILARLDFNFGKIINKEENPEHTIPHLYGNGDFTTYYTPCDNLQQKINVIKYNKYLFIVSKGNVSIKKEYGHNNYTNINDAHITTGNIVRIDEIYNNNTELNTLLKKLIKYKVSIPRKDFTDVRITFKK